MRPVAPVTMPRTPEIRNNERFLSIIIIIHIWCIKNCPSKCRIEYSNIPLDPIYENIRFCQFQLFFQNWIHSLKPATPPHFMNVEADFPLIIIWKGRPGSEKPKNNFFRVFYLQFAGHFNQFEKLKHFTHRHTHRWAFVKATSSPLTKDVRMVLANPHDTK